jgi:4-hydroxybenzoate polyprenyltransferase
MVGNDLADRERDRKLAPARPLPSGRVSARAAGALLGAGVALALGLGGGPSGSRWAVGGALVAALLYDGLLKRFLVPGAVALGLARAANAATGVLPLVLAGAAPWTALLAPLAVGLYAAGVTVWSTTEEVDSTARRVVARVLAASGFLGSGLLPWQVAGRPTLSAVLAFGAVSSIAFARTPRPGPPRRQVLEMLLGLYFLSGGLLTAGDGGSLAANLAGIGGAFGLIYLSQRMVRALR